MLGLGAGRTNTLCFLVSRSKIHVTKLRFFNRTVIRYVCCVFGCLLFLLCLSYDHTCIISLLLSSSTGKGGWGRCSLRPQCLEFVPAHLVFPADSLIGALGRSSSEILSIFV